ncbi:MAG: imidazoleglycerol-phosphate dehydratase [Candidatus Omnitrophica bacterium]|nr:imidazoleglycerol-phosphate dehydratase [Candidatus Omnitrophota bacterium]
MNKRQALIERKTNEVDISGSLTIDGEGKQNIKTPYDSLNHMLSEFAFHGFFDLDLKAKGDLSHHIVEDIGIALGNAFRQAVGDTFSIRRFGTGSVPMEEILVDVSVDICGRPKLVSDPAPINEDNLDLKKGAFFDFLDKFVNNAKITLHIRIPHDPAGKGTDSHHYFEALFKALAIALDSASTIDERRKGIPSTKGVIDL